MLLVIKYIISKYSEILGSNKIIFEITG